MKREAFLARAAELQANLRKAHDDVRLLYGATSRTTGAAECNEAMSALRSDIASIMQSADKMHRHFIQPLEEDDISFEVEARMERARFTELERKTIAGALNYYFNDMDDENLFEEDFLESLSVDGVRMPSDGVSELIERFETRE